MAQMAGRDSGVGAGARLSLIEEEIDQRRRRMDAAVDEIAARLSPTQLGGEVIRALRGNPLPAMLIGVGALWLALAVIGASDRRAQVEDASTGELSESAARDILARLASVCRQGADAVRALNVEVEDRGFSESLTSAVARLERASVALEHQLRLRGGAPVRQAPSRSLWPGLMAAGEAAGGAAASGEKRARGSLVAILEAGIADTLEVFRESLRHRLPEDTRVVVGAHFHELETTRHDVAMLREMVG